MKNAVPDKKIYIIRHGETEYNRLGMVQGSGIDSNLNEVGKQQAELFFQYYQHINFDKVYTSMLKRTHQSVAQFLAKGLPCEKLVGLNEVCWGDREGRIITPEEDKEYFDMIKGWRNGELHRRTRGGESPLEVAERQQEAIKAILSKPEERCILVCMHGRAMRILLCQLLNRPLSEMDNFTHSNLCLYQLDYYYLPNRFVLNVAHDVRHLEEMNVAQ